MSTHIESIMRNSASTMNGWMKTTPLGRPRRNLGRASRPKRALQSPESFAGVSPRVLGPLRRRHRDLAPHQLAPPLPRLSFRPALAM